MRTQRTLLALIAVFACVLVLASLSMAGSKKKGKGKDEAANGVYSFVQAKKGSVWGRACLQIVVRPPLGGKNILLTVSNRDNNKTKYDPIPEDAALVKSLKPGDMIRLQTQPNTGFILITRMTRYEARPGETKPNHFVLVGNSEKDITVSKWDIEQSILLPQKKDEEGEMVPEPKLLAQVQACKAGDVVEVKTRKLKGKLVLVSLSVYIPPKQGEFVRMEKSEDDPSAVSVVIKQGEEEETIPLPVVKFRDKTIADPKLMAAVKRLKAGKAVEYVTEEKDGKTVLTKISLAKKKK